MYYKFYSKRKIYKMVFKSIDGHLTTIFTKTQRISSGFNLATNEVSSFVNKFNDLNSEQDFGKKWTKFLDTVSSKNSNVANMFEDIAKQGASAKASVEDVYAAILQGNTRGFENVKSVIKTFNSVDPSHQQDFARAVGQTNKQLGMYLGSIKKTSASMVEYGAQLVANTVRTIGLKTITMALNGVLSFGIVTVVSGLVTKIFELVKAEDEALQKAEDTAQKYDDEAKALKDLKEQYDKIVNSQKTESEKTQELNEWKETLVATYDSERRILREINAEREKGLGLIDEEIAKQTRRSADLWLGENADAFEKAQKKIREYTVRGSKYSSGNTIFERRENVENAIAKLGAKDKLTSEEERHLEELNKQLKEFDEIIKKYGDTYTKGYDYRAVQVFDDYVNSSGDLENVGKESYLAWKDGLISAANGDKEIKKRLEEKAEKQFPDYQKYFDNIAELKTKYVDTTADVSEAISKMDFINSLDDEELEIATQIPNLFKDGLDGAAKAIEEWKNNPSNKIEANVNTSSLEELKEAYAELSKSASSYTSNQKTLTDALKEQEEHGQLSASTIQSLTEAGYAQALAVDKETGAVTLNAKMYEWLNEQKREAIILETEQQRTELEQKFKEESKAITELATEMQYANQERREAIALEMQQHGLAMADIQTQLAAIDALKASTTAPTFESSSSSSKSEKPQSVLDYEKWVAEQEHKIAMGQLKEDETYYNEKLRRAEIAYNGLADYESDLWKVQEEVYKFREKSAQEAFDKEHDLFEKRVDDLKDYADKLSETSVTSDGTKLTTQEKWQEVASVYKEIQKEIGSEINRIVQTGVEGNEDLLEELEKQLEEYADKISDVFKSAVEAEKTLLENQKSSLSDVYDKEIDKIKKQQEDSKNAADAEIDLIQEKIDSLKRVNDEKQSEYEIEKARQDLENKRQRTRKVYGVGGTITYKQDTDKIKEAQQNLDKLLLEKQVNTLETQKSLLEDMRDKESDSYDKLIEDIESQKEQDERQFDILIQRLDDYLNPNSDTSNSDVWREIAKMDGASYRNGKWVDKDGTEIDITALLSKADEIVDSNNKVENNANKVNKLDLEKILKSVGFDENIAKNLTFEKLSQAFGFSSIKPITPIISQPDTASLILNESIMRNNDNKSQPINVTFEGGINIQNPVGEVQQFAKELMLQLPTAFNRQIHTNLKW